MGNPAKNKGKGFEREVADLFGKVTGLHWQRVPNSGAFIGGKNVGRIQQMSSSQVLLTRGDIIPPDEFKGICIECKFHKDFAFHQLFEKSIELEAWIEQCLVDYNVSGGKAFFVIFKVNRKGMFVCTKKSQFDNLNGLDYIYKNEAYRLCKFDAEWLKLNLDKLKTLCNEEVKNEVSKVS
jgi:Holliday junction resolvase